MKLKDLLKQDGLDTSEAINAAKGNMSQYDFLRSRYGDVNADRIMRLFEVESWDFSKHE